MDGMKLLDLVLDLFLDLSLLNLSVMLGTSDSSCEKLLFPKGRMFSCSGHDGTLNKGTQDISF